MNGADLLCDTLLANGVDMCLANPGTSEMHFVAALDRKPQMRCVLGLFEGVVTGAADGYARMADKPAATLLHLGPGLANGLANIHNARRAFSPMINIVGDHPDHHVPFDAPLTSDITSLATPMSYWVHRIGSADQVGASAAKAVEIASGPPGRIATLVLPADAAWNETHAAPTVAVMPAPQTVSDEQVRTVADALRAPGKSAILLSGKALRANALELASRVAQATGATLLAQQSNGRMERGAGRVAIGRVPYVVDAALAMLAGYTRIILVGSKAPVAFFAYPGKPSSMLPPDCQIIELAPNTVNPMEALGQLVERLQVPASVKPQLHGKAAPAPAEGALSGDNICRMVAAQMPEGAIIVDESVTSGRDFFIPSYGVAQHDYLQLTGGAIGEGLPMSAGAALACPNRKVITLQADGSAMYTVQALWTHARENLDITVVLFSNRRYNILRNELKSVGATAEPGLNARRMLDLDQPAIDWVTLARGMGVEGVQVTDCARFADVLGAALKRRGPFLIECMI